MTLKICFGGGPKIFLRFRKLVHRVVAELRRSIDLDVDVADRESITVWLMRMSGNHKLELYHPRTGKISYQGIGFQGSPEFVFDQYVCHVIEDLVEKHVRWVEIELKNVPSKERERAVVECESAIIGIRAKLRHRAADIKGRLLRGGMSEPTPVPLRCNVELIDIHGRMSGLKDELEKVDRSTRPIWGWLERFAKANPALANIISFVSGGLLALLGAWLA